MKKILYSFPVRIGKVGIGYTAWSQVNEMAKLGNKILLVTGSVERSLHENVEVIETLKIRGIKVPISLFGYINTSKYHDYITSRVLKKRRNDISVVHLWPLGALTTCRKAKEYGIPSFLERPNAHTKYGFDIVAKEYKQLSIDYEKSNPHTPNARKLNREITEYDECDYLFCPSDFVKYTFLLEGYDEKKLLRHHYGYDPNVFYVDNSKKVDKFIAIFVGRGEPRKGLHYILEAWLNSVPAKSGKGELWICGSIDSMYRKKISPLLGHDTIKKLGFRKDVPDLLRQSTVLVLSSVEEGSALVTYESRACGNVLIVSSSCGAECKDNIDALIHEPGEVKKITEQLNYVFQDKRGLEKLQKGTRESIINLTWSKSSEVIVSHYQRIVDLL